MDKVETHNSPSALDPFGGSITGVLGVNRDIVGFARAKVGFVKCEVLFLSFLAWLIREKRNVSSAKLFSRSYAVFLKEQNW